MVGAQDGVLVSASEGQGFQGLLFRASEFALGLGMLSSTCQVPVPMVMS